MNEWQWLVQQAILGVERSGFQVTSASKQLTVDDAGLRTLLESASATDSSMQFLHTAALFQQLRAAGRKPATLAAQATLAACPPETLRPVSEKAAALWRQLLVEDNPRLLCAWLDQAAAARCHLPYDTLPHLLEQAMTRRDLAEHLAPCLGVRGHWLLALNPAWRLEAARALDENDWQTGPVQARTTFLRSVRRTAPDQGRELLAATWKQEAAKDRVLLLATLEVNLRPTDEPFLESCLTDRSEAVRSAAVTLLARLPGSAMQAHIHTLLGKLVRIERKWLRRTLQVELPEALTPEWQRLALKEAAPAGENLGQKAWWLVQLLGLARPSVVAQNLKVEFTELWDYVADHNFARALTQGLLQGAETHADHAFIALYLQRTNPDQFPAAFTRWATNLPDAQREEVLLGFLHRHGAQPFADWHELTTVLQTFDQISPKLSEQLLTRAFAQLLARVGVNYGMRQVLQEAAYRLAPAAYSRAVTLLRHKLEQTPDFVDEFLRIYALRQQMEDTFQASSTPGPSFS